VVARLAPPPARYVLFCFLHAAGGGGQSHFLRDTRPTAIAIGAKPLLRTCSASSMNCFFNKEDISVYKYRKNS
jgi:hypothetical protein